MDFDVVLVDNISSLSGTDFTDSESDEGTVLGEKDKAANLIKLTSGLYGKQHQQRFDKKMSLYVYLFISIIEMCLTSCCGHVIQKTSGMQKKNSPRQRSFPTGLLKIQYNSFFVWELLLILI